MTFKLAVGGALGPSCDTIWRDLGKCLAQKPSLHPAKPVVGKASKSRSKWVPDLERLQRSKGLAIQSQGERGSE